jgi:hypothetical protein
MNLLKDPLYVIVPLREVLDELTEPGDYYVLEVAAILDETHYLIRTRLEEGPFFLEWWTCERAMFFETMKAAEDALVILAETVNDKLATEESTAIPDKLATEESANE